ncbi:MAG: metalloregulator ArsR/SmtB family transcription factor [Actinomycetota bacterium]|nr:metalloregulator ArsR/SmtB family transcription factor [Actinomycetota bacterium]
MAPTDDVAIWRALSDPTRRRLLDLLRDRPRTTGQLAAEFDVSRFAVMKHLTALEASGLVLVRRRGRERWNHLNAVPIREAVERWLEPYAEMWAGALLRLRDHVEQEGGAMTEGELGSISIEQEIRIASPPERVFEALTQEIGEWWPGGFYGGRVSLEPWVGGRFFEEGDKGSALYGVVAAIEPGRSLRLAGGLGMTGPVAGSFSYALEPDGDATVVALSHKAFGDIGDQAQDSYEQGWTRLLSTHLVDYLAKTA